MPKLLKLKNKPFWIAAAIILIVGIAFYKQRSTEGFATTFNVVGGLWYGKLKELDDKWFTGDTSFEGILDASDESIAWKKGATRPTDDDEQYYLILTTARPGLSSSDVKQIEKDLKASSNDDKEYRNVYICAVVLDSDKRYRDKDGNKIINAYTRIFGMNLLTTTLYWILGGVGGLILLIMIFMMMRNSGSSSNSLNRGNYNNQ